VMKVRHCVFCFVFVTTTQLSTFCQTSFVMQQQPPRPKRKKPTMPKKKKKPLGEHRVAVFVDNVGYRKTKANVLTRSDAVGNKTLKVPKPKRVRQRPQCSFFLRGECLKEDCPYSHVRENEGE
jgi:hypothetical protein